MIRGVHVGLSAETARTWLTAAVVATIAGFALGLGYVLVEGVFAVLSDLGAVAFAVTLLPVAWYLHTVFRAHRPALSAAALVVAVVGLTVLAGSGMALAVLDLGDTAGGRGVLVFQHLGIFLQGVWMVMVGSAGWSAGTVRRRTSLGAIVGGLGYSLGAPVSLWIGFETPLFYTAFLVALAGFLVWALSLRTDLRATDLWSEPAGLAVAS